MSRPTRSTAGGEGFTLVEVLVTVLILGLLAAVVFPVVIQQVDRADPTAASNDLANLRSGIELFELDVRPKEPANFEQVANQILTTESDIDGTSYSTGDTINWNGPYVDAAIPSGAVADDTVKSTGFNAAILNGIRIFDKSNNAVDATNTDFLAIEIHGLNNTQFTDLNDQIDGENEANASTSGRLRFITTVSDSTYFLAVPKRSG